MRMGAAIIATPVKRRISKIAPMITKTPAMTIGKNRKAKMMRKITPRMDKIVLNIFHSFNFQSCFF